MTQSRMFWRYDGPAMACLVLALLTVAWPDWIERISGLDPDGGNGALEWAIVAVFAVCAAALPTWVRWGARRAEPGRAPAR